MVKTPIYVGPAIGMYAPERFPTFLRDEVLPWMAQNEMPDTLNEERAGNATIYHLPHSQMGIEYMLFPDKDFCAVQGMFTARGTDNFNGLFRFFARRARETKFGLE